MAVWGLKICGGLIRHYEVNGCGGMGWKGMLTGGKLWRSSMGVCGVGGVLKRVMARMGECVEIHS